MIRLNFPKCMNAWCVKLLCTMAHGFVAFRLKFVWLSFFFLFRAYFFFQKNVRYLKSETFNSSFCFLISAMCLSCCFLYLKKFSNVVFRAQRCTVLLAKVLKCNYVLPKFACLEFFQKNAVRLFGSIFFHCFSSLPWGSLVWTWRLLEHRGRL